MREDLKPIVASPHDAASIVKVAEVASALCDDVEDLKKRVEALEKEEERRRSQSQKKK